MINTSRAITKDADTARPSAGFDMFIDDDKLVATLTCAADFSHCVSAVCYAMKRHGASCFRYALVDCSALEPAAAWSPGCRHFITMGRFLDKVGVDLLLLDAPGDFHHYCAPQLPDAVWIRSSTGGVGAYLDKH
ncbi:MAG: hypothetical protein KDI01_06190 [Halioglobus sp.]|nr:hypothetical protein [Halioglobus sp.]